MPLVTILVDRVDAVPVTNAVQFCVTGRNEVDGSAWQGQTLDHWKASICRRAQEQQRPIRIVWKEGATKRWGGRYPHEIVSAMIMRAPNFGDALYRQWGQPVDADFVTLHRMTCTRCGHPYMAPGSDPVDCPHRRIGICLRCFRSAEQVNLRENQVRR